jgi:hypothetical protein
MGKKCCGVAKSVNVDVDLRIGMTFRRHGCKGTRAVERVSFRS